MAVQGAEPFSPARIRAPLRATFPRVRLEEPPALRQPRDRLQTERIGRDGLRAVRDEAPGGVRVAPVPAADRTNQASFTDLSPKIRVLVVPLDEFRRGPLRERGRHAHWGAVQRIITAPIAIVFPQTAAHFDPVIRRNGDVSLVE